MKIAGDHHARAIELLTALPQVQTVNMMDDHIAVTFRDGVAGDGIIARTLVTAGIDVLSLVPEQLRLDDAFLQLTQGMVH